MAVIGAVDFIAVIFQIEGNALDQQLFIIDYKNSHFFLLFHGSKSQIICKWD